MPARILVIEDDPQIRTPIVDAMRDAGFSVSALSSAEAAWTAVMRSPPDLVFVDEELPANGGYDILRRIRANLRLSDLVVCMLLARYTEFDVVSALDAGVDACFVRPVARHEWVARVRALLRRSSAQADRVHTGLAGLQIDLASCQASVDGCPLPLSPLEFRLLHALTTHSERVHSRDQLISQVWGEGSGVGERTIDVLVRRLRCALEKHGLHAMLQTVRGAGYRFSTLT